MSKAYTIEIIAFDGVLTSEITGPAEVFGMAGGQDWFKGSQVLLVGVERQPTIRTEEGLRLAVDATIYDAPALDVLLVPGGNDMAPLLEHAALNDFVRQQAKQAQWVGSVCAGAFLLGNAGVLDGKKATTWFGGETRLQAQFPAIDVVHDQPVVVDRRRLTANGGLVSYQAALVLLGKLAGPAHTKEIYDNLGLARVGGWGDIETALGDGGQQ
jgi:transcriptional regulator GlxA family with amidase domain